MRRPVRDFQDVFEVRRKGRELAESLGFGVQAREELVIIISELASNILKYGVSGDIAFEPVNHETLGVGIKVIARDIGPPFANFELALMDGYTDRGKIDPLELIHRKGFGGGLGAVARLGDVVELHPGEGEKSVLVVRYRQRPRQRPK